jgi:hypothetical protein
MNLNSPHISLWDSREKHASKIVVFLRQAWGPTKFILWGIGAYRHMSRSKKPLDCRLFCSQNRMEV